MRSFTLIIALAFLASSQMCDSASIDDVLGYFPSVGSDASKITWSHATNSAAKLQQALRDSCDPKNPLMMMEADIMFINSVPVMAHPPALSSDLTFENFINNWMRHTASTGCRVGVKLDFKSLDAVQPALALLRTQLQQYERNYNKIPGPIMLNADILPGPWVMQSSSRIINPKVFLQLCQTYVPRAILSVGWVTRLLFLSRYSMENAREMQQLLLAEIPTGQAFKPTVTFPVRAAMLGSDAAVDALVWLCQQLSARFNTSLTIWSGKTDAALPAEFYTKLRNWLGVAKVYVDVHDGAIKF